MVSPTPAVGDDGEGLRRRERLITNTCQYLQQEEETPLGLAVPEMVVSMSAEALSEDSSRKIRKPYTITKSRENWTEQEHDKFLEALQLFDRDWKKIEAFVGSKNVIQIRSHAQKYFLKVQKSGTSEHVPPPRPKRKATHPYPQKASKNAQTLFQSTTPFQTSSCLLEPGYPVKSDSLQVVINSSSSGTLASCAHSSVQPVIASYTIKDDIGSTRAVLVNTSSSTESPHRTWENFVTVDQGQNFPPLRALPDFTRVYSFIGCIFDPSTCCHLQKLKEMDPIDVEAVLLLMRNLSINLARPDLENHWLNISLHGEGLKGEP